jgi:hypothetical protein
VTTYDDRMEELAEQRWENREWERYLDAKTCHCRDSCGPLPVRKP